MAVSQVKTEKLPNVAGVLPKAKEAVPTIAKEGKGKGRRPSQAKVATPAQVLQDPASGSLFKDHAVGSAPAGTSR